MSLEWPADTAAGKEKSPHVWTEMIRKLLTKPIWWWERRRAYSVRSRYHLLPPLSVDKKPARFVVLTTPESLKDAMWTAWSWYRYLQPLGYELQVAVDGQIAELEIATVRQLFPGVVIYEVESSLDFLGDKSPALSTFLKVHPLGKKLGLVLALSAQGALLYADYDVLAFNTPAEILAYAERNIACCMVEDSAGNFDPKIVERCRALGLECIAGFNSGLLYVPKGALSIDLAAELLAGWSPNHPSWFTEQTVLSVLMRSAGAQPLPIRRYVVNTRRQFYWDMDIDYAAVVARHFVTPVRHVMYKTGIPTILRQSRMLVDEKRAESSTKHGSRS
jgi:hypothetical protein